MRIQILINLIINLNIKTLLNLFLRICKIDLLLLSPEKRKMIDNSYNLNLLAIDRNYQSKGIGKIFILFSNLFIKIFLLKTLKFEVDGSNEIVVKFLFFKVL